MRAVGRTTAGLVLATMVLGMSGCAKQAPPSSVGDIAALAVATELAFPVRAQFAVTVEGVGTTTGAWILHAPDRFRVDFYSPVGTPLLVVACDGKAVSVWDAQKRVFYSGPDAVEVAGQLSKGALGAADVVRLLAGMLPASGASAEGKIEGVDAYLAWKGPEGVDIHAVLDANGRVQAVRVDRDGAQIARVDYRDWDRVSSRTSLPTEVDIDLGGIAPGLHFEISGWEELGRTPEGFTLTAPAGATERSLVETLKEKAVGLSTPEE